MYEIDDLAVINGAENESGYSSRMEADQFGDLKENVVKEKMDSSFNKSVQDDLEQFYLYRRKKKSISGGENKFNNLSDEIILMILKWLPKKCLVGIATSNIPILFSAKRVKLLAR